MSAITQTNTIRYKGRNYAIEPIRRYLVADKEHYRRSLDSLGFRTDSDEQRSLCCDVDQLLASDFEGGIVIGNGDVGKTWFTREIERAGNDHIKIRRLQLRDYDGNNHGLKSDAKDFFREGGERRDLVLDGLDENPKCWSVIVQIHNDFCDASDGAPHRIWLTSRQCDAVRQLMAELPSLHQFMLLPFSRDDVRKLAESVHESGDEFLSAILEMRIANFAAKAGGAMLLLKMYGEDKIQSGDRCALVRNIAISLLKECRGGVSLLSSSERFAEDEMLCAAGWIATRLFAENHVVIWNDDSSMCPDDCLAYERLLDGGAYGRELIAHVTESRLFEPLSDTRLRFVCDTLLFPFLAAHWIYRFVPRDAIPNLFPLDYDEGDDFPRVFFECVGNVVAEVMIWLSRHDPKMALGWVPKVPFLFFCLPKVIEGYGVENFYAVAEKHYCAVEKSDDYFIYKIELDDDYELMGNEDLARQAIARLKQRDISDCQAVFAVAILGCTDLYIEEGAALLVDCLLKNFGKYHFLAVKHLVFNVRSMSRGHDWPFIGKLGPLLEKTANLDDYSITHDCLTKILGVHGETESDRLWREGGLESSDVSPLATQTRVLHNYEQNDGIAFQKRKPIQIIDKEMLNKFASAIHGTGNLVTKEYFDESIGGITKTTTQLAEDSKKHGKQLEEYSKKHGKLLGEISKGVASIVDWVNRLKDQFWHVFGIRKNLTVAEAKKAMGADGSYLRRFDKCKMKEPHKSQVMAVARWTHNGHPIVCGATQSDIQNKKAYTITDAARDVLEANREKWEIRPGAWDNAKDLADGCRGFMGRPDDPFMYKQ